MFDPIKSLEIGDLLVSVLQKGEAEGQEVGSFEEILLKLLASLDLDTQTFQDLKPDTDGERDHRRPDLVREAGIPAEVDVPIRIPLHVQLQSEHVLETKQLPEEVKYGHNTGEDIEVPSKKIQAFVRPDPGRTTLEPEAPEVYLSIDPVEEKSLGVFPNRQVETKEADLLNPGTRRAETQKGDVEEVLVPEAKGPTAGKETKTLEEIPKEATIKQPVDRTLVTDSQPKRPPIPTSDPEAETSKHKPLSRPDLRSEPTHRPLDSRTAEGSLEARDRPMEPDNMGRPQPDKTKTTYPKNQIERDLTPVKGPIRESVQERSFREPPQAQAQTAGEGSPRPKVEDQPVDRNTQTQEVLTRQRDIPQNRSVEVRQLSVKIEEMSLKFRLQGNNLSVEIRTPQEIQNYMSFLEIYRLSRSLQSIGVALDSLRVNGTDLVPKGSRFPRREERERFNIRGDEGTSEKVSRSPDHSSDLSLLL